MNNLDIREPINCSKTDEINWHASLAIKINDTETDFENLSPAGHNQILFDISSGRRSGCMGLHHDGCLEWSICYKIHVNNIEADFEDLTDEEQEEIRWEIALDEIWNGSFECAKPIWGEAVAS